MSRATSPPVYDSAVLERARSCTGTLPEFAREHVAVQSGQEFVVGIPTQGRIECNGCGVQLPEAAWRVHTGAPPTKLISGSRRVLALLRSPLLRCCPRTETLSCHCLPRTGWAVRGNNSSVFARLGLACAEPVLSALAWLQDDPTGAGAALGLESVGATRGTLSLLAAAEPYAVLPDASLVYHPGLGGSALGLWPAEFKLAAALFTLAGAVCPKTCPCGTACLRGVARALHKP
jgi:hypothetical protein